MMDFFSQVVGFLSTIIGLIINILEAFVRLVYQLPVWMGYLYVLFAYLPAPLLAFAIYAMLLSIVLFIVGRNG